MDPAPTGKRIAFFGGSFDPPHLGHLVIARAARAALELDAILFAPVGTQPLKPQGATASFDDRLEMTRLAIAGEHGFEVSLIDAPRANEPGRLNYTIDTLATLRAVLPEDTKLFCLVGADSYLNLRQWHRATEIPFAAELIVAARPGQVLANMAAPLPEGLTVERREEVVNNGVDVCAYAVTDAAGREAWIDVLPRLQVDVSATEVRAGAVDAARDLVPEAVKAYIRKRGLYRQS